MRRITDREEAPAFGACFEFGQCRIDLGQGAASWSGVLARKRGLFEELACISETVGSAPDALDVPEAGLGPRRHRSRARMPVRTSHHARPTRRVSDRW